MPDVSYGDSKNVTAFRAEAQKLKEEWQKCWKALKDERRPFEVFWRLIDEVVLPYVFQAPDENNPDAQQNLTFNTKIFDGTIMDSSQIFANAFTSQVVPRGVPFVNFTPQGGDKYASKATSDWADRAESSVYSALNRSTFYKNMTAFVKQGADYGTSAYYRWYDDETGRYYYETLPRQTYYIKCNRYGIVDTLWREVWMCGDEISEMFPLDQLEESDRAEIKNNPDRKFLVLHIVEPRESYDGSSMLSVKKKWGSYYVLRKSWGILEESGYDEFPYRVWRPYVEAGLSWGMGPGIFCVRDSHALQQIAKTMIDAANRAVDPPWAISDTIEGEEELFPGGRNYLSPDDIKAMQPLVSGINYPIGKDVLQDLREGARRHYLVDVFLVLTQMEVRDRTALEVSELQAEKDSMISSIINSFTSDCLDVELESLLMDMISKGQIDKPKIPGAKPVDIKFEYIGPLPTQQRMHHKTANIRRMANEIFAASKFNPEAMDWFDDGSYFAKLGDGWDASGILKDATDVQNTRKQRQQMLAAQAQQAQAMQKAQVAAEVASKGGQTPQAGSLAEGMGIGSGQTQ